MNNYLLIFLPTLTAILSSYLTYFFAVKKYKNESVIRFKEEKYLNMLSTLKGFQNGTSSGKLKEKFFEEKNKSLLYASDEVIKAVDNFINFVILHSGEDGKKQTAHIALAMRKDLLGRKTKLTLNDINFFHVTYKKELTKQKCD